MIQIKLKEVAIKHGISKPYQLQKLTGFLPSKAASLWNNDWQLADLKTLNTLCNLFKCTPNDILEFTPDEVEE